jgi:predicted enzyme related to lactoylglutathione lyase
MAVVSDPGGTNIGVWQPGLHQGFGVLDESGAPSWFELHTRDYQAAVGFYREVFGWETHVVSDTPEFRHTTLKHGESWLAGIMDASGFLPDGVPAHWSVYFGVDDTDAALARIVDLGGTIVMAAEDTPYGRLGGSRRPDRRPVQARRSQRGHAGGHIGRCWLNASGGMPPPLPGLALRWTAIRGRRVGSPP